MSSQRWVLGAWLAFVLVMIALYTVLGAVHA